MMGTIVGIIIGSWLWLKFFQGIFCYFKMDRKKSLNISKWAVLAIYFISAELNFIQPALLVLILLPPILYFWVSRDLKKIAIAPKRIIHYKMNTHGIED